MDRQWRGAITSPVYDGIRRYLEDGDDPSSTLFVLVPYIRVSEMTNLAKGLQSKIAIVTTWKDRDLISGSSDIELYPFCKKQNITLYINNRIHLKVYSHDMQSMVLTTANISSRGLGTHQKHNYECAYVIGNMTVNDRLYLNKIINESHIVDDQLYDSIKLRIDDMEKTADFDDLDEPHQSDTLAKDPAEYFLISALPMTKNVKLFIASYEKLSQGKEIKDSEVRNCVMHDLTNYSLDLGMNVSDFESKLRSAFFSHPFIQTIDSFIEPEAYFGRIKEWVQDNCTNVPVPSRRELTGNVQVLLEWFEYLGSGKYVIDIPGRHSQRIRKT